MKKSGAEILKEEENFHDNWAKGIDINNLSVMEAFEGPVSPEYRFAIEALGDIQDKTILNPGCGAGEEAVYLAGKGAHVFAFDLSSGMLDMAKRLASKFKLQKKIEFKKMNAEKLELEKESFDYIFANAVLHHIDLESSIPEFYRVLKKGGKAVFIEPLFYNPLINLYRRLAKIVRTSSEHPLKFSDLCFFDKHFEVVRHYEFQFLTLLIFCYFFVVQRVNPNKDRYWKKVIREGRTYERVFRVLYAMDKILLSTFPLLKRFCWITVIEATK